MIYFCELAIIIPNLFQIGAVLIVNIVVGCLHHPHKRPPILPPHPHTLQPIIYGQYLLLLVYGYCADVTATHPHIILMIPLPLVQLTHTYTPLSIILNLKLILQLIIHHNLTQKHRQHPQNEYLLWRSNMHKNIS